jgi:hypothetical protein
MLHPLRDNLSLSLSSIDSFNLPFQSGFSEVFLTSFISGGMFCDHFHCGVGRVEGVAVDRIRNDGGMGGMWRKKGERRKCVNFSPNKCGKYLTSQDV